MNFHPKQIKFFNEKSRMKFYIGDNKMIIKNERALYPFLIQEANKNGWNLYRIEDAGASKKPFDIGGISNDGKGIAIEVKFEKEGDAYYENPPEHLLSKHQSEWLNGYANNNAIALFIVYYAEKDITVIWQMQKDKWKQFIIGNNLMGWTNLLK